MKSNRSRTAALEPQSPSACQALDRRSFGRTIASCAAATHSVEPGLTTSWEGGLRRCETLAEAGLAEKTLFCFGHITDRPDARGGRLEQNWLGAKAEEIKRRYPEMPGVAFFQATDPDTPELRQLVRFCDRLSGELWPDPSDS